MNTKLLPPTIFYAFLLLSIVSHILVPTVTLIRPPYSFLGVPLILVGAGLTIWADALFKKGQTPVKPADMPVTFVTEGPFRISRHPMYLGMAVILLGVAIVLGSVLPFAFPILFVALMERLFISMEEANLEQAFGEEYRRYKKRVRRWI